MAPMTRKTQANPGITKKVHRKRGSQPAAAKGQTSDSWELLDTQRSTRDLREDAHSEEDEDDLALEGPLDVDSTMDPLREMADRIGNEVETFAQLLDEMLSGLPSRANDSQRFEWANETIQQFQTCIEGTAKEMEETYRSELQRLARKEWAEQARLTDTSGAIEQASSLNSSILGGKKTQQVKAFRDLKLERDLWTLMHTILELKPFAKEAQQEREERAQKLRKMGPAHRYTSEDELWERFQLSSEVAIERNKVKEWLEKTADESGSNMEDIVAELQKRAGRGSGLWKSGWLHTREKIKGEKRLRNWPEDLDANPPEVRRAEDNDLLAVRLDPDAPTRQQRVLEKQDAYFERAIWITCWEMLRRGTKWEVICQWCEEQKEGWRASCLGLATDTSEPGSSRAAWRHLCRLAAQSGCSSDHEAAVFGLLGGDESAMKKVCHSANDQIYAFYNAKLMRAFDSFVLATLPDKYAQLGRHIDANAMEAPKQAAEANEAFLARLRKESATREELLQPLKVVQTYILSDEVGSLLNSVGVMIGETARAQGADSVIFFRSRHPCDPASQIGEREVALNPQTLRMVAHMSIIWRILRNAPLEADDLIEDDNILVAYIQALRMAGKRDLIPIYAARLAHERSILVLGRMLQDVQEGEEQTRMLQLLEDYKLDVIKILEERLSLAFEASFGTARRPSRFKILESTTETKLHPGQRIIAGFMKDDITGADEALVTSLQWFQLYHGHWERTFKALTEALTRCLLHNNLPCARLIIQSFPCDQISRTKTHQLLGAALNLSDSDLPPTPDLHEQQTRDLFARQSRTYHELELLVRAIEALARWRDEENKYITQAAKPSTVPASLKEAKTAVTESMEPLLKGILSHPRDEEEEKDLSRIRRTFLPEMIIAYNTVLHAAGNLITRDALLESMDLSVAIANEREEDGNGLAKCFQDAGRMRELVSGFALTSKAMLVLKAEGKPWKARKDREGKELGVWEIGGERGRVGA